MEYGPDDSSGTDDDLPPSHHNRVARGPIVRNGRTIVSALPYSRLQNDMEVQIHRIEQEAYSSVLRAFKAQSDAITWEKESLITELRKELRVSDQEHRELLNRVNADEVIQRIREWRQAGGVQTGIVTNAPPDSTIPSPTVSASRKKQKTSQPLPSLSLGASSPALHSQFAASMQPSSSAVKRDASLGTKGKKPRSGGTTPGSSSAAMQYLASGRGQVANRNTSGSLVAGQPTEPASFDPLIGRKIRTRWPEDNNFYEAVIFDYNPVKISPEDIRWEDDDPGMFHQSIHSIPPRGVKKTMDRGYVLGTGRGSLKNQKKEFPASQNGIGLKSVSDFEAIRTDIIVTEVERVLSASDPDPQEFDKAKKMLQEHERVLIDAIAKLAQVSDDENGEVNRLLSHGQTTDQDQGRRNQQYGQDTDLAIEGRGGIVGNEMVTDSIA